MVAAIASETRAPKIIFWGSPEFSLAALEACSQFSEILAVVSQPDRERGRGHELLPTPVKTWANNNKIKTFTPASLRAVNSEADSEATALLEFLMKREADFYVVVAYGKLLPDFILNLPLKVPVNIHASLLPRWRGAAPVQRALEAGDKEGGVSLQRMVSELDAGDVYLEKKILITDEENAEELFQKYSLLGAEMIEEFLTSDFNSLKANPQNSAHVSLAKKIRKDEGLWKTTWTSREFHNRVRAFYLWPKVRVAFSDPNKKVIEIKILESKIVTKPAPECPQPWGIWNSMALLRCGDGQYVQVLSAQFPGKGPIDGSLLFSRLQEGKFELISVGV